MDHVTINTVFGDREIPAKRFGLYLCVHRELSSLSTPDKLRFERNRYVVTHIPTGKTVQVPGRSLSKQTAEELAQRIDQCPADLAKLRAEDGDKENRVPIVAIIRDFMKRKRTS